MTVTFGNPAQASTAAWLSATDRGRREQIVAMPDNEFVQRLGWEVGRDDHRSAGFGKHPAQMLRGVAGGDDEMRGRRSDQADGDLVRRVGVHHRDGPEPGLDDSGDHGVAPLRKRPDWPDRKQNHRAAYRMATGTLGVEPVPRKWKLL